MDVMDTPMLCTCPVVIGELSVADQCVHLAAMRINANAFCNLRTLDTACNKQTPWRRRGIDYKTFYFTITYKAIKFILCLEFTEDHQVIVSTFVCATTRDLWLLEPKQEGVPVDHVVIPTHIPTKRCTNISTGWNIAFHADAGQQEQMTFTELPVHPLDMLTHIMPNNRCFQDYLQPVLTPRCGTNPAGMAQVIVVGPTNSVPLNAQPLSSDSVVLLPPASGLHLLMYVNHYFVKPFPTSDSFCSCFRDELGVWYIGCLANVKYFGSLMVNRVRILEGTCVPIKAGAEIELFAYNTIVAQQRYKIQLKLGTSSVLGERPLL